MHWIMGKDAWKYSTPEHKVILVTLLMMADHQEKRWDWKGKRIKARPGQFVTSLDKIRETAGRGISLQNIRSALAKFQNHKIITNESTKTGRLITIVDWGKDKGTEDKTNKATNKETKYKAERKKIKGMVAEIKALKEQKITHGMHEGTHPAYRLITFYASLPSESKIGFLVETFIGLFPQPDKNFVATSAVTHDIFAKTLNQPLCNEPEDILKEIVYYEGNTFSPWDVQKIFKNQQNYKGSFARMRYEIDKAKGDGGV